MQKLAHLTQSDPEGAHFAAELPWANSAGLEPPTSTVLKEILRNAPEQAITLRWLFGSLGEQSFGIVLLLLGPLASLPGPSSPIVGAIVAILACQMILARRRPALPACFADKGLGRERLAAVLNYIVPPVRYIERHVRPKRQIRPSHSKRIVGIATLPLGGLLFAPIPLSNVPPALAITLLAVAYLEEDGVLLFVALSLSVALVLIAAGLGWEAISAASWIL